MFSRIVVLSLLAASAAVEIDLENYTFEKYVSDFRMKYTPAEIESRRATFSAELARVRAHNAKGLSWKEGINKFSAMTEKEKKAFFGRSKNHAAKHGSLKNSKPMDFPIKPIKDLPSSVDWRTNIPSVVTAVKDQGYCGSCWAFASTAVIESHVALQTGNLYDLSVQQIAMCSPNPNECGGTGGCEGATAEIAFDYLAGSDGLFEEYQYSYASYYGKDYDCALPDASPVASIDGFVKLPENNATALMNAVATLGPIAISVDASKFGAYKSGVFDGCDQNSPDINHAVVLMGYGTDATTGQDYWLIRNSWAPDYGELGYIRVLRTSDEDGRCGIDVTPQDGSACKDDTSPVKVCGTCGVIYDTAYPTGASTA